MQLSSCAYVFTHTAVTVVAIIDVCSPYEVADRLELKLLHVLDFCNPVITVVVHTSTHCLPCIYLYIYIYIYTYKNKILAKYGTLNNYHHSREEVGSVINATKKFSC